jgi:hypothetical protein
VRVRTDTQQQLELFASTSLCLPVLILQTPLHTSDASSHTRAQTHTVTGAQTNYHTRAQTNNHMLRRYPPWNKCSVFGIILYYRYRRWQTQTHIANTSISSKLNHTPSVSAFETRRAKTGQDRNDGLSAVLTISIQKGGVSTAARYQPRVNKRRWTHARAPVKPWNVPAGHGVQTPGEVPPARDQRGDLSLVWQTKDAHAHSHTSSSHLLR